MKDGTAALPPENYGAETPKPIDRFDEADVALVRQESGGDPAELARIARIGIDGGDHPRNRQARAAIVELLRLAESAADLSEAATEARTVFPDESWQHSRASADAADGLDAALKKYREQRAKYDRMVYGEPKVTVPRRG